jgi:tetratricopeptide (TPR) repeat protein
MARRNYDNMWARAQSCVQTGDLDGAQRLCAKLVRVEPKHPGVHYILGYCERMKSNFPKALRHFEIAQRHESDSSKIEFQIASVWYDLGDFERSETWYRRAVDHAPNWGGAWSSLGDAVSQLGRKDESVACYRKALDVSPNLVPAAFNLAGELFDENDLLPCEECLELVLSLKPDISMIHFYLGVVHWLQEKEEEAERDIQKARDLGQSHLADSFDYMRASGGDETRFFGSSFDVLAHAMKNVSTDGLFLEFGVRFGTSIRFLASLTGNQFHGFDSFEGIPEDWGHEQKGKYSTYGKLPSVPTNVSLHTGWFSDTLPGFLKTNKGNVAFANIDSDLYSSAKDILESVGPRIQSGTILVFDEYINYPTWRDDEFKAFQEYVSETGTKYEYLAFGPFSKQAVVQII